MKFAILVFPGSNCDHDAYKVLENIDIIQQRYIPGKIMQEVFLRDKGKCVVCGSEDNLHYDHKYLQQYEYHQ